MLLISSSFNYLVRLKSLIQKKYTIFKKHLIEYWHAHSGDWHWLIEKPKDIATINRNLWRTSFPSFGFYFMLGLSGLIATMGLLANSVAIIIGAMIIAPLMGPIIGIAYSMVVANRRLLRRSSLTVFKGIILTVVTSWVAASILGLTNINSEILSRTNPTLLDLGIALAAGAAGAFAHSRHSIADALPGVAIAVALVPPLSVVGIGLASGQQELIVGAFLLFLTNLTGIVFSGGVVFLFQSYGSIEKARQGLIISILALLLLGVPLGFSLEQLLVKERVRRSVDTLIRHRTVTFSRADIRSIKVNSGEDIIFVKIEVAAPLDSISENQVQLVRNFISRELKEPVRLKVRVIPIKVLDASAI
ncbi:MAG: TIGR00341 family protein [Prochloraceae cyanobacterium]|nr:TIGR00341 family protein [Prochloraceae cyanobacterium]